MSSEPIRDLLKRLAPSETPKSVVDAVMESIDETAGAEARAAGFADSTGTGATDRSAAFAAALASRRAPARSSLWRAASYVGTALMGAAAALFLWIAGGYGFGATWERETVVVQRPDVEPAPTRVVRVLVEVPVPIDRVVEKIVEVERVEQRLLFDPTPIARGLERLSKMFEAAREANHELLAARRAEASALAEEVPEIRIAAQAATDTRPLPKRTPAVQVRRDGGRISLRTRGSLDEVVPALIMLLDGDDPEVTELVTRRLETIQGELEEDPAWSKLALAARTPAATETRPSFVAALLGRPASADAEPELRPSQQWSAWWRAIDGEKLAGG